MKNKFFGHTLFTGVLAFVLITMVGGCKKKEADALNFRMASHYTFNGFNHIYSTFVYDEQGRISKILGAPLYAFITYSGDSAFYKEYRVSDNGLNSSFSIKLGAAGRFMNDDFYNYEYNSSGQVVKRSYISNPSTYTVYNWQDGNMVKEDNYVAGVISSSYDYIFYTDKPNTAKWNYFYSGIDCFFAPVNKNLIKRFPANDVDCTYEIGENSLPEKMTIIYNTAGIVRTNTYTYELAE